MNYSQLQGWVDDKQGVEDVMNQLPFPVFSDVWTPIKDTGKGKVTLLYDIIRKVNSGLFPNRHQTVGDCLAKDSIIIGPDCTKMIQDISVGDRVYSGNGEITTVISTICKKSYNPIIIIHTAGGTPLRVTSDHKVLAYRFGKFAGSGSRRYSPGFQKTCIEKGGENSKAQGNVIFSQRTAELIPASELQTTDYILCPSKVELDSRIPDEMLPYMGTEDLRWMIGLFLGDGHAKKSSKTLEWGCTTDEPKIEDRLCKTLDSIDIEWKSYFHCKKISKKAKKVYTTKIEKVYNLFRKYFYDTSGYKNLPSWAINDDVIRGLLDADGYLSKDGQTQCFENTSPSLIHGLRIWALNNGYIPSLNQRQRFDKRTNSLNKIAYSIKWKLDKKSHRIWRDDEYLAMPITKIETEEGPHAEVYDIGVDHSLHTFITGSGSTVSNCVSQGGAYAVDASKAVDIYVNKDSELWVAETSTEDLYWGSRNIIGQGRLGNSDGSIGAWMAKYLTDYGALPRGKYGDIDLTTYSGAKARSWGRRGFMLPQSFVDIAKQHPIMTASQVKSYNEVRDLVSNGYAVTIASNQGFSSRRDKDGFAKPEGSWAHQMCILGVDDSFKRPGVLVQNSWGAWNSGPVRHKQPVGSFWVDASEIERRVLRSGDCWAISGYEGFKPQKINARIY